MFFMRKPQPSTAPDETTIIHLRRLVKTYRGLGGDVQALKGIDLEVYPGEFVAVTGKSGSGKTTLVNLAAGLDFPTAGEIYTCGAALHRMSLDRAARWRSRKVGVIFQSFELLPGLNVLQNVMLPMDFAGGWSFQDGKRQAMDLLEKVEIAEHAHKRPSALSGGQQQRVAIARALANDPAALARQGRTIFMVTHDADITRRADRTITLVDGQIVE